MDLNDYLAENGNWIGVHSTAAITGLAPAEWRAVVIAAAQLSGAEPGIDCLVVEEADELADIEARVAGWLCCSAARGSADRGSLRGPGLWSILAIGVWSSRENKKFQPGRTHAHH